MDVTPDNQDDPALLGDLPGTGRSANGPLPRSEGERAEVTQLAARVVDAADAGDAALERSLSVELARLFASHGTDLDEALRLARRALVLGEDPELRAELSGWLAGVGEPGLAAAEMAILADLHTTQRAKAKAWMRAAVLYARAGNATSARAALAKASEIDPNDAIPHELAGTLAAWSPDDLGAESAAEAYLRAARLRDAASDPEAAFEDTLRAFETARGSSAAAQALVAALKARGRHAAADEVLCLHAEALSPKVGAMVHLRRFTEALQIGDLPRALVSIFDAKVEVERGPTGDDLRSKVDELLARVGMYDLLAARLTMRAVTQGSAEAAETYEALARLAGGPLARPDRAIDAHLAAASLNPDSLEARRALRDHAGVTGDIEPLVEALVRIATSEVPTGSDEPKARVAALRELAELAQERLADPLLALWAFEALERCSDSERETVQLAKARLSSEAKRVEEEIAELEASLGRRKEGADDARDARVAALSQLAKLYRSKPEQRSRWIEVLASLVRAEPLQTEPARALERVMTRRATPVSREERELYESVLRARMDAALPKRERARVRRELARLLASQRAPSESIPIEEIAPLLAGDPAAAAELYVLATLAGAERDRAQALLDLAEPLGPPLKAMLLAVAAEMLVAAGDSSTALRAAESATSAAPSSARAARALARVAALRSDRESASALERAMGILAPTVELCASLALALDGADEPSLAFAWTQRWLALTPSSPRAIRDLVRRAITLGDASRLGDALAWVLAQPEPFAELAAPLLDGLQALFEIDLSRAKTLARKALDVFGPKDAVLRRELITLGDQHGDRGLAVAALERWIATMDQTTPAMFLDLATRRMQAADLDGAARELSRAALVGGAAEATIDAARDLERVLSTTGKELSPDGRVWFAEAVARSLSDADGEGQHSEPTLSAWRALGALRWDLAEDYRGSEQALFAACDPVDRFDLYAQDLVELAGAEQAVMAVRERAQVLDGDPKRTARLLTAAARAAAEQGLLDLALDTAVLALEMDASQPEAVAVAEASARGEEGALVLSRLYEGLARAAMGIYGQRAAHYRAARQLERRGAIQLALKHAIASFEAVPTEGTSWQLVTRLVERTGDSTEAVRVLERIGQTARPEERTAWLKRAALLTRPTQEGLAIRLDILLRALLSQAESGTIASIEETITALLAGGETPDLCSARFERALYATLPKLEGPDGAFVAVRLAGAAARVGLVHAALTAMTRGLVCDAGHGAFAELARVVDALVGDVDAARTFVAAAEKSVTSGKETLELAASLARGIGDEAAADRLRAEVERRDAEDRERPVESFDLGDDLDLGSGAPAAADARAAVSPERTAEAPLDAEAAGADSSTADSSTAPPEPPTPAEPRVSEPADSSLSEGRESEVADEQGQPVRVSEPPLSQVGPEAELLLAQRDAHARGDHEAVAEILQKRIEIAETEDARRVPRLRRAALLEQRLGRLEEACEELEAILRSTPDDPSALSFLADLYTRTDQTGRAAPLWEKMAEQLDRSDDERVEFALRAVRGFIDSGDPTRALTALDRIAKALPPETVAELRVTSARASGDQLALALALDELSSVKRFDSAEEQAHVLFEAAQAALASGDESGSLLRLRRAVRLDPTHTRATLEALRLEYRTRGTGTPREAQAAVDALASVTEGLPEELVELHTFLLAEELDVIQGGGAGMRELTHRHAEVGPLPLVALGMAERLARNRSHEQALPLFEKALEGDFQGLRSRGRVVLAAADSAIQVRALELATKLLDEAQKLPETRSLVDRRRRELLAAHPDLEVARAALEELIGSSTGLARARFLERLAELRDDDRGAALALYEEALTVGRHDRSLTERVRRAIALLRADDGEAEREVTPPASKTDDGPASDRPSAGYAEVEASEVTITSEPPPRGMPAEAPSEASAPPAPPKDEPASTAEEEEAPSPPPVAPREDAAAREEPSAPMRREEAAAREEASVDALLASLDELPVSEVLRKAEPRSPTPTPVAIPALSPPPQLRSPLPPPVVAPASARPPPPEPSASNAPQPAVSPRALSPEPARAASRGSDPAALAGSSTTVDRAPESVGRAPDSVPPPSRMPVSRAVAVLWPSIESDREEQLFQELLGGSFDAGEVLIESYGEASRTRDVLVIRRHQAALRPGQRDALEQLLEAAIVDKSTAYARAVEHVLSVGVATSSPPPPLSAQIIEPELLQRLLFRDLAAPVTEALSLVWESGLYRRDLGAYRLDKAPRIQPGDKTPLAAAYSAVLPLFGQRSLFQAQQTGPLRVSVALLSQPALVVEGDVRASGPDLQYLLASRLAATMPEFAIVAAEPDDSVRTLLDAIVAAFGPVGSAPPASTPTRRSEIARIGAELWQRVQPRTERRLRALAEGGALSLEEAREKAQTAMRRAGLFASGDLGIAVRITLEELGEDPSILSTPDGLEAASKHPEVADLVRLATRMEYAEARFFSPLAPAGARRPGVVTRSS